MASSSSSSSCPELFNPDIRLRRLVDLSVVKADGTEIDIASGPVILRNGSNMVFELAEDEDELTMVVDPGSGVEDPYFTQKHEALVELNETNSSSNPSLGPFEDAVTGIMPGGDDWTFTFESMWLGAINNAPADPGSGAFFVVNDRCANVGEFESEEDPGFPQDARVCETAGGSSAGPSSSGGPSTVATPNEEVCAAELAIFDVCIPCTDCLTWIQMEEYLERIQLFYDYILELNLDMDTDSIPDHPDGGVEEIFSGVYAQYIASARYWDSLVHRSTLKMAAQGQGQSISIAGFYRNISDGEIGTAPDGVTFTFTLNFQKDFVNFLAFTAANTDVRRLDRADRDSAELASVVYDPVSPPSHTIVVTMISGGVMSVGGEIYVDFVILLKDTDLFDDGSAEYTVDIDMVADETHIGTDVSRSTIVHFVPAEEASAAP